MLMKKQQDSTSIHEMKVHVIPAQPLRMGEYHPPYVSDMMRTVNHSIKALDQQHISHLHLQVGSISERKSHLRSRGEHRGRGKFIPAVAVQTDKYRDLKKQKRKQYDGLNMIHHNPRGAWTSAWLLMCIIVGIVGICYIMYAYLYLHMSDGSFNRAGGLGSTTSLMYRWVTNRCLSLQRTKSGHSL